jgi:hypothetical protein
MKKIIATASEEQYRGMNALQKAIEDQFTQDIIPATGAQVGDVDVFDYNGVQAVIGEKDPLHAIMSQPMYSAAAQMVRGLDAKASRIRMTFTGKDITITLSDAEDGYLSAEAVVDPNGHITADVFGTQPLTAELLRLFDTMYDGMKYANKQHGRSER